MHLSGGDHVKKYGWIILALALVLTGCQAVPTFETLGNVYASQDIPEQRAFSLSLPAEAAAQTITGDTGTIYFCDDYEIVVEILSAGDLDATVQTLTGFDADALTLMQTKSADHSCYECAWTSAAESGFQVGRAKILDDGIWHYCLSVFAPADDVGVLQDDWQELFDSFTLAQS